MPPSFDPLYDTLIAGAGLAGAAAALHLSRHERVLLVEARRPAAGASGAAAGLVNPLMAWRARLAWRADDALEALHETLALAGARPLFDDAGIVRPAANAKQARCFREAAAAHPDHGAWLPPDEARQRYPQVVLPHGALQVRRGGAIDVAAFVGAMVAAAERQGAATATATRLTGWRETGDHAAARLQRDGDTVEVRARRLLLALGDGFIDHPALTALALHRIKGQTVRVAAPGGLAPLPPLSGRGYVVRQGETLVVGSSYEHAFTDLAPSAEQTRRILRKAARMLPGLDAAPVLEERAGVRVTVPEVRLPLLGPLPGHRRVWVLTGLGSKGLLMAPLLARRLAHFFRDPTAVPADLRVR